MKSKTFLLLVISTCFLNARGLGQTVPIIGTPSPSTGGSASYPGYYGRDTSLYPPTTITDSNGATYGLWFSASSSVFVGQTVYLFATPSLGYSFTQWTGDANSTQNPLGITATTDLNVTAIFTPDPISLTIPVSPTSGGVVYQPYYASDPGGGTSYSFADSSGQAYSLWYPTSQSVVPGTTVYLYAVPATGYSFSEWTGDANGTENPVPVTAGSDLNVSASFQLLSYNLTAQVTGDGNVSGTGTYTYGAQTTLSATPGTGSSFLGWDSYDSSSGTWAAGSGAGSLD